MSRRFLISVEFPDDVGVLTPKAVYAWPNGYLTIGTILRVEVEGPEPTTNSARMQPRPTAAESLRTP